MKFQNHDFDSDPCFHNYENRMESLPRSRKLLLFFTNHVLPVFNILY